MRRAWPLAAAVLLAGCAHTPDPTLPESTLPGTYADDASSADAALRADWWTLYGDAALDRLVDAALARNADLQLAVARVDEAAGALGIARAAQWPGVDLDSSATRARSSALAGQPAPPAGTESTSYRIALSSAFEIDLWGRLRNASAAARAQLLAAQYARDAVRLTIAGTAAQLYFALRAFDAQIAVVDSQLIARRDSLNIIERRLDAGAASTLEQAQARGALAATAALEPELRRQRALLAHQLGALTGAPGLVIEADATALPVPMIVPPGLPSALLVRRPDVRQAEASLRAARAQIEVARAAMFPTLSLTGTFGGLSADLGDLVKSGARFWSIGPSVLLPIFDAGRNAARTDQARAQAEQAAIQYQKTAQTAFREVADALSNAEQGARLEAEVDNQRGAAADTLRIAKLRYDAGYSGYLDVLDAERSAQDAELARLRARQTRLDASVALMKALGGGWTVPAIE